MKQYKNINWSEVPSLAELELTKKDKKLAYFLKYEINKI